MEPRNSKFVLFYFKRFWIVNTIITAILLLSSFFIEQSNMITLVYIIGMSFLYVGAKINFELRRVQAALSATFFIIFVFRFALVAGMKNRIGVFAYMDPEKLTKLYNFFTSNPVILVFACFLVLSGLFYVWDLKIAADKSNALKRES